MKRATILAIGLILVLLPLQSDATHNADLHSDNVKLVTNWNDGGNYTSGADIAFWGNYGVFANTSPGGFRLLDLKRPSNPKLVSQFICTGSQSDVSVWENLVFVSVDAAKASDACDAPAASQQQFAAGQEWEGIRVVSIADPFNPQQIATVRTDCGSHTHTLVPDLDYVDPATGAKAPRLILWVLSYPLGAPGARCNQQGHSKISVIEVPLSNPAGAKVIGTPSVGAETIGCHDSTYFAKREIAGVGCINESQLWDVSDPANPKILSRIQNPELNIHHSAGFSWDGNTLVLGDELGGAAFAPGCRDDSAPGSLWFYNVRDLANPEQVGRYKIPQRLPTSELCTAHDFNIVPLRKQRDILVSGWYDGGTTIVDFTVPQQPKQIGYYIANEGAPTVSWSSYWYNGRIYVNNQGNRGIDVLQVKHKFVKKTVKLPFENPSTQLPYRVPKKKRKH